MNNVTVDTLNALAAERRELGAGYTFPHKLHDILERNEVDGVFSHIISWQEHGKCFRIHDQQEFVNVIMMKFFNQTKMASFQRQLNLYGFKRLYKGRDRGCYYHRLFVRGQSELCHQIIRTKVNGRKVRRSSKNDEPNFYEGYDEKKKNLAQSATLNIAQSGPVMRDVPLLHAQTAAGVAARDLYDERQERYRQQLEFNSILHEQRIENWLEMQRMEQQYASLLFDAEKLRRQQDEANEQSSMLSRYLRPNHPSPADVASSYGARESILDPRLPYASGNPAQNRLENVISGVSTHDLDQELKQRREFPILSETMRNNRIRPPLPPHVLLEHMKQQQDLQSLHEDGNSNKLSLKSSSPRLDQIILDQMQQQQGSLSSTSHETIKTNGTVPSLSISQNHTLLNRIQNEQEARSPAIPLSSDATINSNMMNPLPRDQISFGHMKQQDGIIPTKRSVQSKMIARDMKSPSLPRNRAILDKILQQEGKSISMQAEGSSVSNTAAPKCLPPSRGVLDKILQQEGKPPATMFIQRHDESSPVSGATSLPTSRHDIPVELKQGENDVKLSTDGEKKAVTQTVQVHEDSGDADTISNAPAPSPPQRDFGESF